MPTAGTIILANTDYSPLDANNLGARTHKINLSGLLNGRWRQSDKFDLGVPRARYWEVTAAIECASAPTAATTLSLFFGFSRYATAGKDNPAGLSGSDAAYLGYDAAAADALEASAQLVDAGDITLTADPDVQVAHIGIIESRAQFGLLAVLNSSGKTLAADGIEMAVRLQPLYWTNS